MSDAVQWQGSTIEVQARLVPRFLWATASIDVFVGEQCVLRTGGRMKLMGCCSQAFTHSGGIHVAEVSWGGSLLYSFPYQSGPWPKLIATVLAAVLFGAVHLPDMKLAAATCLLGAVFTVIYLRWRNLWPLGLYHGCLGVFFYYWVLGRDPWGEMFGPGR